MSDFITGKTYICGDTTFLLPINRLPMVEPLNTALQILFISVPLFKCIHKHANLKEAMTDIFNSVHNYTYSKIEGT